MMTDDHNWAAANQRYLVAELAQVRSALMRHAGIDEPSAPLPAMVDEDVRLLAHTPPPLDMLCTLFALTTFERSVLLLCAGIELDATLAGICAQAQGDAARPYPTFSLALAALPDAHWSALPPSAPLRRWHLIEIVAQPHTPLTLSQLRVDERILHFLTGIQYQDERLLGLLEPLSCEEELTPTQQALALRIAETWMKASSASPLLQLCGSDAISRRAIAAAGCEMAGLNCWAITAEVIPTQPAELESLLRLWEREAALTGSALYLDAENGESNNAAVTRLLERLHSPLLLGVQDRCHTLRRSVITIETHKPTTAEQLQLWETALGAEHSAPLNGHLPQLTSQFNLSCAAIPAAHEALSIAPDEETLPAELWRASRAQARTRLDDLAQRIEPVAQWDALVLPEAENQQLREIAMHVRQRAKVYDQWGFGALGQRGLGISALFAGPSGTGKTMAAEVLANALDLDLYRVDLSGVVSKYIGETEKNLKRIFAAAEDSGAVLLFDEAETIFGRRSEVKDSHDRYANIEINYLLQRMESYRGLAVLATNRKADLDPAFLRRIRFVINFPFPDAGLRAEIWRRIFPPQTPLAELDVNRLARLNVAGGNIRNIALNAAFLAAEAGGPVRMEHLLRAARTEYAKIERPISDPDLCNWV